MSSSTLLIFGATGYTGRALVQLACAQGHRVVAHVRPNSPSAQRCLPLFEAAGAEVMSCAWEPKAIAQLCAKVDPAVVFALLGTTQKKAKAAGTGAGYAEVDLGMSLMVIDAVAGLEASEPPRRAVYLSSWGAQPGTRNAYLKVRVEVEAHLRAQAQAHKFEYLIARPSFITGSDRLESRPGERAGAVIADRVLGALGLFGMGKTRDRFASITATQLAAGLLAFSTSGAGKNAIVDSADLKSISPE